MRGEGVPVIKPHGRYLGEKVRMISWKPISQGYKHCQSTARARLLFFHSWSENPPRLTASAQVPQGLLAP
jgi:hypothetical protein